MDGAYAKALGVSTGSYAGLLKNEATEARQQGLLGIFVWQQAVVRYLEEFADKRSLSDDRDHRQKLDP
jgi:hypothetical protein